MGERNPAHSPWGQQDQSHSAMAWSGKPRIQEYRMRPAKTAQKAGLGPVTGPEIAHGRRQSLPPAPEPVVRVLLASAHSANCCSGPGARGVGHLVTTAGDGAQSALLSAAAASNEAAIP